MLNIFRKGLSKTRTTLFNTISSVFTGTSALDEDALEAIEEGLILADVSFETVQKVLDGLRDRNRKEKITRETLDDVLRDQIAGILTAGEKEPAPVEKKPRVILMTGVNGTGKTTSIGKLAARFGAEGKKVVIAACDTFRSAATEQVGVWAERAGARLVAQKEGADPAAVAYDALAAATAEQADVLLIDTAGRLHTKTNLMEELKKIKRVLGKSDPSLPHEVYIVLDATVGQNGVVQVRSFHEAVGTTGIILTKIDGTAKGGVVLTIADQLQVPIRYIGVGEGIDDLKKFDAKEFAAALCEEKDDL